VTKPLRKHAWARDERGNFEKRGEERRGRKVSDKKSGFLDDEGKDLP
jgi:hypothetical protein